MGTRIRYKRNGDVLTSKVIRGLVTTIDLTTKTFTIVDVSTTANSTVASGGHTNVTVLKQKARKALMNLGVDLVTEKRTRVVVGSENG